MTFKDIIDSFERNFAGSFVKKLPYERTYSPIKILSSCFEEYIVNEDGKEYVVTLDCSSDRSSYIEVWHFNGKVHRDNFKIAYLYVSIAGGVSIVEIKTYAVNGFLCKNFNQYKAALIKYRFNQES